MTNISSINHTNFARLHELTNNYNKATLLDKLIFWWQISNYTLDDGQIWFTRCLNQIAEESKISKRSVERYLHEFELAGFIEKTNKLYKKKNLYIRITEKLLVVLGTSTDVKTQSLIIESNINEPTQDKSPSESLFLKHFGGTDHANLAVSIYKDQDNNLKNNNTVSEPRIVDNVKNNTQSNPNKNYPSYPIEKEIGEQITEQFKNYVKGTMRNLESQHQLVFSNPEQVFAEIIFSVMQVENQFPGVLDNQHRLNLIAKLLRNKQWRTPKGFFNHWAVGQMFKSKLDKQGKVKEQTHHASNAYDDESGAAIRLDYGTSHNVTPAVINYQLQAKLKPLKCEYREVLADITTETRFLNDMESRCLIKPDNITKELIASTAMKIARLYEKSVLLEEKIKREERLAA